MPNNGGWGDWGSSDEFNDESLQQSEEQQTQVKEDPAANVKPVNLPKKVAMFVLIGLCLLIIIGTIVVSGTSIRKEVNSSENEEMVNPGSQVVSEIYSEPGEVDSNFSENSAVLEDPSVNSSENQTSELSPNNSSVSDSLGEEGKVQGNTQVTVQTVDENQPEFVATTEPILGEENTTTGMVLSKGVFRRSGSYFYNIQISIVYGQDAKTVDYFCPKGTYDALNSGDILNVTYAMDNNGYISITSIANG